MRKEAKNVAYAIIIILLICLIASFANKNLGVGSKEVKLAREFVSKLIENNVIDEVPKKALDFKIVEKKDKDGKIQSYTLDNEELLIEMNKDGNITKFINKVSKGEVKSITNDDAIKLAEKYIVILCPGEYRFDKIIDETLKDDVKYYSIRFKKYDKNYPYYSLDAILNINKETGKLEGYVNHYGNTEHEDVKINITEKDAKEKALKSFNSIMNSGEVLGDVNLAYGEGREEKGKLSLCYIVKIKGKADNNVRKEVVYFISAKTGEIINSFNSKVEEIKTE